MGKHSPGFTKERRNTIINNQIEDAEEKLLISELAYLQAEVVDDLLLEGEESRLEVFRRDVEAWKLRLKVLKEYLGENQ